MLVLREVLLEVQTAGADLEAVCTLDREPRYLPHAFDKLRVGGETLVFITLFATGLHQLFEFLVLHWLLI